MTEQLVLTTAPGIGGAAAPLQVLARTPPFAGLAEEERERVAASLTLADFRSGEAIIERLQSPGSLFLIIQGLVDEFDPVGLVATHAPGETFDSRALMIGRSEHRYVARGRASCYLMPSLLFLALVRHDREFREYFENEATRRLDVLVAVQQQREVASVLISRLGEGRLHPAIFVGPDATIGEAARIMQESDTTAVLVRRNGAHGIFTERDLRERHILMGMPVDSPIGDLASYDLQTIQADDYLFNALVAMTRHSIRHLVVKNGEEVVGLFEQADLLRHLSKSSHVIASRVNQASTVDELKVAGSEIPRLVRTMSERGVKPRYIARVVTDLNRTVFRRVFETLTPPDLLDQSCLMVMGSEGRGEQLLRTDQDNGLILRSKDAVERIRPIADAFNRDLSDLGYPPCRGDVMVSNPLWAKSLKEYEVDVRRWVTQPSGDAFLNLAILCDASPVAGDGTMLEDLKAYMFAIIASDDALLGHFARATMSFPTPLTWLNRLAVEREGRHAKGIDLKKGGLFPIVHGVRSLALQFRLPEVNTVARVQALSTRGIFGYELAADLIEAFDYLSMLRLRAQYAHLDDGEGYDNYVNIDHLSRFERNMLRASFKIVRDLKSYIREHFRLQLLM